MSLLQEVKAYLALILDQGDIEIAPDDKIVTAVSGGPDSLTLLHLLTQRGLHPAENVIVAHLDHQLRPSSAEEAHHVHRIAAEWNLVCRTGKVDVEALAREHGLSLEEAGRLARYQFLGDVAAEFDANYTFTGHHADDQAETVLMHILRGSGSAGLRGMLPVSPFMDKRWLVRPLLNTSREQIEAYCRRHQLNPIIDETNTDTTYYRNRLRHELLPILETYNPQIRDRLLAMAAVTAADYAWLQQQTVEALDEILLEVGEGWIRLDQAGWQRLPLSLRRNTLRMGIAELRPSLRDVGYQTIEQARLVGEKGQVGAESTLPGQVILVIGYEEMILRMAEVEPPRLNYPQLPSEGSFTLPVPGHLSLANDWLLKCEILTEINAKIISHNNNPWLAFLDAGDINSLTVRSRKPGERFQPLGLDGHTKTVKAVMIDQKIPADQRSLWPIVAGEHLVWIPGLIIDERVKISAWSKRVLKLTLTRLNK